MCDPTMYCGPIPPHGHDVRRHPQFSGLRGKTQEVEPIVHLAQQPAKNSIEIAAKQIFFEYLNNSYIIYSCYSDKRLGVSKHA